MNEKIEKENEEIETNNDMENETKKKIKTAKRYAIIFDKIKNEELGIEKNENKDVENEGVKEK